MDRALADQLRALRDQIGAVLAAHDEPDTVVIPRNQAALADPRHVSRMETSQGIVVHWSAGSTSASRDESALLVRAIQRAHMAKGWDDIGYSFLVDDAGNVFEGRGWGVVGAHTRGLNDTYHGVCWLGGRTPSDAPSEMAVEALRTLVAQHTAHYGATTVTTHRDNAATACPGNALARIARELNT